MEEKRTIDTNEYISEKGLDMLYMQEGEFDGFSPAENRSDKRDTTYYGVTNVFADRIEKLTKKEYNIDVPKDILDLCKKSKKNLKDITKAEARELSRWGAVATIEIINKSLSKEGMPDYIKDKYKDVEERGAIARYYHQRGPYKMLSNENSSERQALSEGGHYDWALAIMKNKAGEFMPDPNESKNYNNSFRLYTEVKAFVTKDSFMDNFTKKDFYFNKFKEGQTSTNMVSCLNRIKSASDALQDDENDVCKAVDLKPTFWEVKQRPYAKKIENKEKYSNKLNPSEENRSKEEQDVLRQQDENINKFEESPEDVEKLKQIEADYNQRQADEEELRKFYEEHSTDLLTRGINKFIDFAKSWKDKRTAKKSKEIDNNPSNSLNNVEEKTNGNQNNNLQ